jgi:hypothetical protein
MVSEWQYLVNQYVPYIARMCRPPVGGGGGAGGPFERRTFCVGYCGTQNWLRDELKVK